MHVQIKHSLTHLQELIPNLAGVITCIFYTSQSIVIESCRCAREMCIQLHVFELTIQAGGL